MIQIRYAEESDAEALLSIYSYYVANTAITFEWDVPALDEFRKRIIDISKFYPYIVAYDDDAVLGYAYASPFNHRKAYEWCAETSIYVDINHKRHGIGKLLYTELEELLVKQGILRIYACIAYSETVQKELDSNSFGFHRAIGYSQVGMFPKCGYKFGKWFDMVWMEKKLSDDLDNPSAVIPFPDIR